MQPSPASKCTKALNKVRIVQALAVPMKTGFVIGFHPPLAVSERILPATRLDQSERLRDAVKPDARSDVKHRLFAVRRPGGDFGQRCPSKHLA